MKGRQLTKCVFHSGKCLYRLLACACRNSVPNVGCLSNVSNVDKLLQGNSWLSNRVLLVEMIQPICQQRDVSVCGPSAILKIEESILRVTYLIGRLLCPVTLQTVLKILNPIGHSWNMVQDEALEFREECLVTCDEETYHMGSRAD